MLPADALNTSYVMFHRKLLLQPHLRVDLNTSYVKVQHDEVRSIEDRVAFKYILC